MPPKAGGGGVNPNRRNHSVDGRSRARQSRPLMGQVGRPALAAKPAQSTFNIAPLILEGATISKIQLNDMLKKNFGDVKISNIQSSRTGSITIQASDIKSFNKILNEFQVFLSNNGHAAAKLFVPRSIQRIKDTEKVAFVKRVDLEIPEDRIIAAIKDAGIDILNVARLNGKDGKTPTQTVRITFGDVANRNTFVKTGLQVDYMHFEAESASHNTKPTQCFLCLKYNHVAKYCKTKDQKCARCGDNHRKDLCTATDDQVKCCNCNGKHEATSNECKIYQEQAKKMKTQVERYSSSSRLINTPPKLNDNDFPQLPNILSQNGSIDEIINAMSNKLEKMFEESTLRLFYKLEQRIAKIEESLGIQTNRNDMDIDPFVVTNPAGLNIDNNNQINPSIDNNKIDPIVIDNNDDPAQLIPDSNTDSDSAYESKVAKYIKEKQALRENNVDDIRSKDVIPKTPPPPTTKSKLTTGTALQAKDQKPKKKKKKTETRKRALSLETSLENSTLDV